MGEITKREDEAIKKLLEVKKEIEAQIFNCETSKELKYLGAIYLNAALRIFISTQGFKRTQKALLEYIKTLQENA